MLELSLIFALCDFDHEIQELYASFANEKCKEHKIMYFMSP